MISAKKEMLNVFIERIPNGYLVKLGKLLGMLFYFLSVPHRRLTRRNLKFCYPAMSSHHIRDLSKRIFRQTGITFLEILQSAFISKSYLLDTFQIEGREYLAKALKDDHGVIIVSGHLANWERGFQFAGCYFGRPITGVARNLRHARLDRWFYRLRTRFGNKIIYKKGALPKMRQTLRRGEMLALTMDQSRGKQAIGVKFFGRDATATPAPALLAMRCKSPVLPMFCFRGAAGNPTIHVDPPIKIQRTGDLRADLKANTQRMMTAVEDMIRRYPDQWIWFQRPWKKTYPELYPEWEARRKRRKKNQNKRKFSV
jgi:KDO2-lipid IV(A) lauroyltransferase